jgi:hypothetical protein
LNGKDFIRNSPEEFEQVLKLVKNLSPALKLQLREHLNSENIIEEINIREEQKMIVRDGITRYKNAPGNYLS